MPQNATRELPGFPWGNAEFFGEKALASVREDEMDARHARVSVEQRQCFLRQNGATGSGYTYGNDLSLRFSHTVRG
jgi:hypothetical protein